MFLKCQHITDIGVKRDHNEDCYLFNDKIGLFIVCDGMGGHAAGEVASKMTIDIVSAEIHKSSHLISSFSQNAESIETIKKLLKNSIEKANYEIFKTGQSDQEKKGMGTTIALLLILKDHAFIAHVGDSRVYFLREDQLSQLTIDHSLVNDMLSANIITQEQAKNHPRANVISRAIGLKEEVEVDVKSIVTLEEDSFLLCSDGLYEYFEESELESLYIKNKDNTNFVQGLVKLANERGGKDNITIIIVDKRERKNFFSRLFSLD